MEAPVATLTSVAARAGTTPILRSIDFELGEGEAVGIHGANGAGKTTLLRVLATYLRPSAGSVVVLGADGSGDERFAVRSRIGLIGHVPALYAELTLEENLGFAASVRGVSPSAVSHALTTVGLAAAGDRRADACSHGMQRRTEFARELMLAPDLILLDEPHSALDPSAVELVGHLVESVTTRGGGAVLVSHDLERVAPLVDRTLVLDDGVLR